MSQLLQFIRQLKRFIDVVNEKLVLKVVHETNDENDVSYRKAMKGLEAGRLSHFTDTRQIVELKDEMALYFVENEPTTQRRSSKLPQNSLSYLANGEEYCSDEENLGPVDAATLKRRFNIQDSEL
ncbi:hypothetical protein HDV02_001181 [Globomyces sp. JEL0801]|nr:hypothetical protein HDV02_001181 [Globomyces sp. JEL0801]